MTRTMYNIYLVGKLKIKRNLMSTQVSIRGNLGQCTLGFVRKLSKYCKKHNYYIVNVMEQKMKSQDYIKYCTSFVLLTKPNNPSIDFTILRKTVISQ